MDDSRKSKIKILIVWVILIIIIALIIFLIIYNKQRAVADIAIQEYGDNMSRTREAIIVKVSDNNLGVVSYGTRSDEWYNLYYVNFAEEGNIGFKVGQEIKFYYTGREEGNSPAYVPDVGKIEIISDKTNRNVADNIIKVFYNSHDKVSISINEVAIEKISFTITDTNELHYDYSEAYRIYKAEKEPELPEGISSTQNTNSSYANEEGFIWKNLAKISNIKDENIKGSIETNGDTSICTYNWKRVYGNLESGKYQFRTYGFGNALLQVIVDFTVNANGEVILNGYNIL